MPTSRRDLLKTAAAGALGFGLAPRAFAQGSPQSPPQRPPRQAGPLPDGIERASKPLRILILGGTGFTGPHQVKYALARGHKLTLFNRGRNPYMWPGEVEELTGDRNTGDLASLKGREWDVCIDNPTTLPFWVRDAGQVLEGKVGQYIFISSLSVHSSETEVGADESAPVHEYKGADPMRETQETFRKNVGGLFGPLKARSEKEAEVWFPGITTIIRPTLIVGPGDESDRFTYWPVRLDRGGDVLAPGDGTDNVQFIDARDLAEWTVRMAESRAFGVFTGAGPGFAMTMMEMLMGVRAATTAGPKLHWVPAEFLREQKVRAWSDMPVWVPGTAEMAGFARRSNRKAIAAGLTFRPLAQTALDTLAWFKAQTPERQATLASGIKPEREREVLAAWAAKK
ncbi:MAG: twin-arginine translocation signal domain-containing protein [Vicinamibacterales bacterium]|nr:twin-arginine translocation signal domain-containing protein [Vicinamibacterales bacterium]